MTMDQVLVFGCSNPGLSWAENNAPPELALNSEAVMFASAAYNAGIACARAQIGSGTPATPEHSDTPRRSAAQKTCSHSDPHDTLKREITR